MRLDKYLSHATPLSRNDARKAIKAGRVRINNNPAASHSQTITLSDCITLDDTPLQLPGNRYLMLNKPAGFICATEDSEHPTIVDLIKEPRRQELHAAGRLDKDTTGLVLLTDDGHWSHRVTSPSKDIFKRYRVTLAEPLTESAAQTLCNGLLLNGESHPTRPAKLEWIHPQEILLSISEGKYHQVKRMLAAVGNHVIALHREAIGAIELDASLQPGHYRPLTDAEIQVYS